VGESATAADTTAAWGHRERRPYAAYLCDQSRYVVRIAFRGDRFEFGIVHHGKSFQSPRYRRIGVTSTENACVERHDFHPVTDRELRHVPDSSIWSLPSTS